MQEAFKMNALQSSALLERIFAQIQDPVELMSCAAVNRGWRAASQQVKNTCLQLTNIGSRFPLSTTEMRRVLHWLQIMHQHAKFTSLTEVVLRYLSSKKDIQDFMPTLTASLCTMAGSWPLQLVEITGWYDIYTTVLLLPASMKHLELGPSTRCLPSFLNLDKFSKFANLETLSIVPHDLVYKSVAPENCFYLASIFSSLTSLSLSNWPLALGSDCSFAGCLPALLHACIHLLVRKLQTFMALPALKVCILVLINYQPSTTVPDSDSHSEPFLQSLDLLVGKHRPLRHLTLYAPTHNDINLCIEKAEQFTRIIERCFVM